MKRLLMVLTLLVVFALPQHAFAWDWQLPRVTQSPVRRVSLLEILPTRAEALLQTRMLFKESVRQLLPADMPPPPKNAWHNAEPQKLQQ